MDFSGDDFWIYFRVQLFPWFDSGYMLRQFTAAFVRVLFVFSVMLGSTLDTFSLVLCCRVVVKVFLLMTLTVLRWTALCR